MSYLDLRYLHISCAVASISLFVLRGGLSLAGMDWRRRQPLLRWLPHVVDSVLLLSAIALAVWSGHYPGQQNWLTAKVLVLLAYIGFGRQALRPGLPADQRVGWFAAALLSVGYIVAVALSRSVLPFA